MASDSARLQVVIESQYQGAPGLEALRRDAQAAGVTIERLGVQTSAAGQQIARLQGTAAGAAQGVAQQIQAQVPGTRVGVTGPDPTALVRQRAQAEAQANAQAIAAEQQALAQVATARQRAEQQAERDIARLTAAQERETQRQVAAVTRAIEQTDAVRQREADRAARIAQRQAEAEVRAAKEAADAQVALVARVQAIRSSLASGQAVSFQVQGQTPQQLAQLQQNFRALGVDATQTGEKITQTGQRITTLQAVPGKLGVATSTSALARAVAPAISGEINDQLARAEASGIRLVDAMGPKLTAGLRASSEEMSKFAQGIGHGLGLFSSFGAGIGTAVVVAAITAAIAGTTRQFAEFDRQVRGTNALLGLVGEAGEQSFRQMEQGVRAFAVATGTNAVDDTKALYQTLSAGIPVGAQAFQVLQASANLAVGGLTDTRTAADGLTSVLNAYGLSAADASRVSDQFFATTQAGKLTMAQLGQGIGTVVPIAAALGVNFGEVAGVLAAATNQGVQAGVAFEGTRAALNAFLRPSAEAQQIAAQLGVQFDAAAVRSRGFAGALNDVVRATGTGPGGQRLLATLFGDIQAVNTVLAITGPNAERTASAIGTVSDASGNAARAAAEVDKSLGRAFDRAGAEARDLSLSVGGLVAGPLADLLTGVNNLVKAFAGFPKDIPPQSVVDRMILLGTGAGEAAAHVKSLNEQIAEQQARQASGPQFTAPIPGLPAAVTGLALRQPQVEEAATAGQAHQAYIASLISDEEKLRQAWVASRLTTQEYVADLDRLRQADVLIQQLDEQGIRIERNEALARLDQATAAKKLADTSAEEARNKDIAAQRVGIVRQVGAATAPQEAEIGLGQAVVQQRIAEIRATKEGLTPEQQRLEALQNQLQALEAQKNITVDLASLNLNLDRVLLEQAHTRERALDLENQSLDATIRANDAREQGIRLGFVVPALQRVATAMGANVDPNSPEFQRLNVAQQFVALRLSTAQAQLRQGQIAADPGKLAFDAQSREIQFRQTTADLAKQERDIRLQLAQLPLEAAIRRIEQAQQDALKPLNDQLLVYQAQSAELNTIKAAIQWLTTHIAPSELGKLLVPESVKALSDLAEGLITPETQQAAAEAWAKGIAAVFPNGLNAPAVLPQPATVAGEAPTAGPPPPAEVSPQPETVPIPAAPATVAPVEAPATVPVPEVLAPPPAGGPLAPVRGPQGRTTPPPPLVPIIRGTGVQGARNVVVNNHVNVDASNQTDPNAIATATASATSQATIDAIQTEFSNSPSSNSIGAR